VYSGAAAVVVVYRFIAVPHEFFSNTASRRTETMGKHKKAISSDDSSDFSEDVSY